MKFNRLFPKPKTKQKAFTLIELLVVITIVGLLFAILTPAYGDYFRRAQVENSMKTLETALTEAFSLSRSQSKHFLVKLSSSTDKVEICEQNSGGIELCGVSSDIIKNRLGSGDQGLKLDGNTVIEKLLKNDDSNLGSDLEILYKAPHGDTVFYSDYVNSTLLAEDIVKIVLSPPGATDASLIKTLKIYQYSGLAERE